MMLLTLKCIGKRDSCSLEKSLIAFLSRVTRNPIYINHYILYSLWCGIKGHHVTVMDYSSWILGNRKCINFWLDCWFSRPLIYLLTIILWNTSLVKVGDYLSNFVWYIPQNPLLVFLSLLNFINTCVHALEPKEDQRTWNLLDSSVITLKSSYVYLSKYSLVFV